MAGSRYPNERGTASGTPDFRKPALVLVLLFLASRGLFAAALVLDGMDGCGCLAPRSRVSAWPTFVIGLGGLYVTATRGIARERDIDARSASASGC